MSVRHTQKGKTRRRANSGRGGLSLPIWGVAAFVSSGGPHGGFRTGPPREVFPGGLIVSTAPGPPWVVFDVPIWGVAA